MTAKWSLSNIFHDYPHIPQTSNLMSEILHHLDIKKKKFSVSFSPLRLASPFSRPPLTAFTFSRDPFSILNLEMKAGKLTPES
jgi:hypothetical protein